MLYRTSMRNAHRKNTNEDATGVFSAKGNKHTVGKSKPNFAQGKSKSHKKKTAKRNERERETRFVGCVCNILSFLFEFNQIIVVNVTLTHAQSGVARWPAAFSDFLNSPSYLLFPFLCFSFSFHPLGLFRMLAILMCCQKRKEKVRAPVSHPQTVRPNERRRISDERQEKI